MQVYLVYSQVFGSFSLVAYKGGSMFFISEWKHYGFKLAFYNLVFVVSYKLLGAKRMSVTKEKK